MTLFDERERLKKIRRIISDNIGKSFSAVIHELNKGGFTTPAGGKYNWTRDHVKAIISGEVWCVYRSKVSSLISENDFKIVKASGNVTIFVRDAISEKIQRDKLEGDSNE